MACGACGKARARRASTLEKRRAAARAKQEAERQAKALAAQQKLQLQQKPIVKPSAE